MFVERAGICWIVVGALLPRFGIAARSTEGLVGVCIDSLASDDTARRVADSYTKGEDVILMV